MACLHCLLLFRPQNWHSALLHTLHVPRYPSARSPFGILLSWHQSSFRSLLKTYDCSALPIFFPVLWPLLTSYGKLYSAGSDFFSTSASVRPPRVRAITFLPYICRIYNAKFGQYWTLSCFADSSALHCLICVFCSSDREFARVGTSQPPHPASFRFHLTMDTLAFG